MTKNKQSGFSTVELLITLFIAAAFLASGYQLYSLIIKEGGEARMQARAINLAYDYLQRYKGSVTNPCTAGELHNDADVAVDDLYNVSVVVTASCPYTTNTATPVTSLTKIEVVLSYGTPQQTVEVATYATP